MEYRFAEQCQAAEHQVPDDKRIPFGWGAVAVGGPELLTVKLSWLNGGLPPGEVRFRIAAALDVREELLIEAVTAESSRNVGLFDIRYASVMQPFEILLSRDDAAAVLREGVELRMTKGSSPFWIFFEAAGAPAVSAASGSSGNAPAREKAPLLFPHLLISEADLQPAVRTERMLQTLASLSSIQAFGWLEGCVLDGLLDLGQALGDNRFERAARSHLELFFDEEGRLKYENPRSQPADGKVYGIEGTLPFAALARLTPEHPAIGEAVSFWLSHRKDDGSIWDGSSITAEGSYTVAYPMAVIAGVLGREDLAQAAIAQLEARRKALTLPDGDLFLRWHEDGSRTFRHWARAHAWYLLGLIRTIDALRSAGYPDSSLERSAEEFVRAAGVALAFQAEDGLWPVFINEPDTGADTSGSAGIAAALALGAGAGLLPVQARDAAERALQSLLPHLSPDGILGYVAQSNKGGEALQRSGYRVLFQMATGLAGQLYAALRK